MAAKIAPHCHCKCGWRTVKDLRVRPRWWTAWPARSSAALPVRWWTAYPVSWKFRTCCNRPAVQRKPSRTPRSIETIFSYAANYARIPARAQTQCRITSCTMYSCLRDMSDIKNPARCLDCLQSVAPVRAPAGSNSKSSARFPKRKFGRPLCSRPSNSPGPRNFKSASAILKPSFVSSKIFNRSRASTFFASEIKMQNSRARRARCARATGATAPGRTARHFQPA